MRIPPSVIVMSVVTAVPFGLGVRDTFKKKEVSAEEFGDDDWGTSRRSTAERERELAEYEAEATRYAAEREAKAQERIAKLDEVIGAKPAQLGSLFDGIVLGADAGSFQPDATRERIERETRDGFMLVSFDADVKQLNAVEVSVYGENDAGDVCQKLEGKLVAAWGKSTNGAWLDPTTHQRASLDQENCKLRFERYLEPAQWVAQLPFAAIGMSDEKLADALGGNYRADASGMSWNVPGVGYGTGSTIVHAVVHEGKVLGISLVAASDFDSTLAVRDALAGKLKAEPKRAPDDGYGYTAYEWKKKPAVTLEASDRGTFTVELGKQSWD